MDLFQVFCPDFKDHGCTQVGWPGFLIVAVEVVGIMEALGGIMDLLLGIQLKLLLDEDSASSASIPQAPWLLRSIQFMGQK